MISCASSPRRNSDQAPSTAEIIRSRAAYDARGRGDLQLTVRERHSAIDAELKRAKRVGSVLPFSSGSAETLDDFAKVWFGRYVVPSLARHTQLAYASMLDVHIGPRIGDLPLRSVTAEVIWELRASMSKAGVGDAATRKTLVVLQSLLQRAVEWGCLEPNRARLVRQPSQTRTRVVRPLSPLDVEGMRKALLKTVSNSNHGMGDPGLEPGTSSLSEHVRATR